MVRFYLEMKLQFSLILWRNKEVAKVKLPSKYFYHEVKHRERDKISF